MVFIAIPAGFDFGNPGLIVLLLFIVLIVALIVIWLTKPKGKD